MGRARRRTPLSRLRQALDEIRFGNARTLNLRETLPTAAEAVARAEAWLRQRQVLRAAPPADDAEVLIITGRGNSSPGGVSVVRESIVGLLHRLRRAGVITGYKEHTPGSFVVTLAAVRELWDAPKRRRVNTAPPAVELPSLEALDGETRALLRALAERSLDLLGVRRDRDAFVESEMLRQFAAIAATLSAGPEREERLRAAIRVALDQYD
jgi:hypothetical protein